MSVCSGEPPVRRGSSASRIGVLPKTRSTLALNSRGAIDSRSNSIANASSACDKRAGNESWAVSRATRGGNVSTPNKVGGSPCGSSNSTLSTTARSGLRNPSICRLPNLASQSPSISADSGFQISAAFWPADVRRTIQSPRIPRPLPKPSRRAPTCRCALRRRPDDIRIRMGNYESPPFHASELMFDPLRGRVSVSRDIADGALALPKKPHQVCPQHQRQPRAGKARVKHPQLEIVIELDRECDQSLREQSRHRKPGRLVP